MSSVLERTRAWASALKRDGVTLWFACKHRGTPLSAKALAGLVVAYALSPVDPIPDFIPVLGYLDDLIIVPLGILLAAKLVPVELMIEFREEAARRVRPVSRAGLAFIVAIWLTAGLLLAWLLWPDSN